jgi:hypothetical protein
MYIHKYKIGDEVFFRVTKSAARPSKNQTITFDEWRGYSSGSAVSNALKFLNSLTFSKEKEELKEPEKKAFAISNSLRVMANRVALSHSEKDA